MMHVSFMAIVVPMAIPCKYVRCLEKMTLPVPHLLVTHYDMRQARFRTNILMSDKASIDALSIQ